MRLMRLAVVLAVLATGGCEQANERQPTADRPAVAPGESVPDRPKSAGVKLADVDPMDSFTLRYAVPAGSTSGHESSAATWGVAAPVAEGFSDPNKIVYDDAHINAYVTWAITTPISCAGPPLHTVVFPDGVVAKCGVESYMGGRFRAEDLIRFLKARIDEKTVERVFRIDNPHLVKIVREYPHFISNGRLRFSPWDIDVITAITLLSRTRYKPVYPLLKKLADDPSKSVRYAAVFGLGHMAGKVPEALDELGRLLPDKELGGAAGSSLRSSIGLPVLMKAINHTDPAVRYNAVYSLVSVYPVKDAMPGVLAALNHYDPAVRNSAVRVLLDIQTRGNTITHPEIIAAVTRRSTDPFDQDDTHRHAKTVLTNLK